MLPTYVSGPAQIVTVVVANLPVYDPFSRFEIQWAIGALQQLITPTPLATDAAKAAARNPDGSVNISFALPQYGSGLALPIQVNILPTSLTTPVATTPVTPACLFNYVPPVITGVAVVRARFTNASTSLNSTDSGTKDTLAVACPFPPSDPVWSCAMATNASLLMIVIQV
jgi:hypothetical protein